MTRHSAPVVGMRGSELSMCFEEEIESEVISDAARVAHNGHPCAESPPQGRRSRSERRIDKNRALGGIESLVARIRSQWRLTGISPSDSQWRDTSRGKSLRPFPGPEAYGCLGFGISSRREGVSMSALPTATVAALLAVAATLATEQTQGQMPARSSLDPNATSRPHPADGDMTDVFTAKGANCNVSPYLHKRAAMKDVLTPTAFAATAAQDGMTEVALGGLALQRSRNSQVKQFAQRMVHAYGQSNQELQSIVKCKGLILPTKLDDEYEAMVRNLNKKSGADFDKAYVELVAKSRDQMMVWFEAAARSSDPDVAAFSRKAQATLQEHKLFTEHLYVSIGMGATSAR